jgi:TolA-binding protein
VPQAEYKIASAYYNDASYSEALTQYVSYYNAYPATKDAGEAHYWAGRCQERLYGSTANGPAHDEYCTVITQYPNCSKVDNAIVRRDIVGAASCP